MSVIENCTVYVETSRAVIEDTSVLFKDSGFVRVGDGPEYTYYPRESINKIEYEREGSE